jgi:hypothetical protein
MTPADTESVLAVTYGTTLDDRFRQQHRIQIYLNPARVAAASFALDAIAAQKIAQAECS